MFRALRRQNTSDDYKQVLDFLSHREMKNERGEAGLLPPDERGGASSSQKA